MDNQRGYDGFRNDTRDEKRVKLALINLNEGASDEKYSGLLGVASVIGKLNAMEKIHLTRIESCDTL